MSKDPALLFYTSDFLTGTTTFSNEEVGMYIRLLCLQHQQEFLYEEDMIFICKSYNKKVYGKFEKDGDKFFNKRLKEEADRRKNYSDSRSKNRSGKGKKEKKTSKSYVKHMETETITEIINYLNEKAKTKFSLKTEKTLTLIQAKLNCGFTVEDFRKVIDVKCKDWFGNPEWSKFLRPETLFGNKFEGYLNEKKEISPKEETYEERQREKARRDGIILP